jgi:hypothetical protein
MIHADDVRRQLALLAVGKVTLDDFEEWIVRESWNMFKDSSPEAIDLVSSIHVSFSERDDRILSKSELQNRLLSLLNHIDQSVATTYTPTLQIRVRLYTNRGTLNWISATSLQSGPSKHQPISDLRLVGMSTPSATARIDFLRP